MKKLLSRYMTGVLLCLTANNALAERLQWKVEDGGNGHYYEGFDANVIWSQANKLAKALGGHLVTITSDPENRWVFDNVGKLDYFLGGTDALEEGKWTWVTNEEWVYDRWNSSEPNNGRGHGENFLSYGKIYLWNDLSASYNGKGFIVEYENGGSSTQSTPQTCQPATLSDDLKLHIPLLHYSPLPNDKAIMLLSIDMKIKDPNQLLFKVLDYKVIK